MSVCRSPRRLTQLGDLEAKAANESTGIKLEPIEAQKVDGVINEIFEEEHNEEPADEDGDLVDVADIPGWTLERWLSSLKFDAVGKHIAHQKVASVVRIAEEPPSVAYPLCQHSILVP